MMHLIIMVTFSGWKSVDSVPKLVDSYMKGELKVDEFVSHTLPLDKINEAFELMNSGKWYVTQVVLCFYSSIGIVCSEYMYSLHYMAVRHLSKWWLLICFAYICFSIRAVLNL